MNVSRNDHIDHLWETKENFYEMAEGDRILDITGGKHYTAVATEFGKIYGAGYIFYRHF